MGKYFGTDGFRGEAGVTLTADHAYKVGRFLGWYYNMLRERNGDTNPARIVIGKDTRCSSYMFEYSLVAGLTASGADAYLLHITTTPSVAYIARVDDFDCGIMISASHNPYYDNGIKLIDCYGEKMPEETLLLVEDYDGDADRCLCVDEKGNVITGNHILYIYGCYMKERGKLLINTVVTTVMSNFGLYKAFDEKGIGYAKTAVGDKYVYEYMAKNGGQIGGEQSGHIIFSKYASTGDGILTSLKMMEVMLAKKVPMSKLAEPLKIYPQVLENVRVTDKKVAQDDAAVQEAVKAVAEALGDTGRILVRESGTEPVVRVMVEAPDHDTCQKYVSQVVETIKSRGYGV